MSKPTLVVNEPELNRKGLLEVHDDLDKIERWTVQEIPVTENYAAALAFEGTDLNVTCRDWDWA